MADEANPKGMKRPTLSMRSGYGPHSKDDPKTSRPMIPVHTKAKRSRPMIAVGEGNDPKGMQRPNAPYDQALDPDTDDGKKVTTY